MEGIVKAVCISLKRGTAKKNIHESELIKDFGIKNDAHGGNWHRQVSMAYRLFSAHLELVQA